MSLRDSCEQRVSQLYCSVRSVPRSQGLLGTAYWRSSSFAVRPIGSQHRTARRQSSSSDEALAMPSMADRRSQAGAWERGKPGQDNQPSRARYECGTPSSEVWERERSELFRRPHSPPCRQILPFSENPLHERTDFDDYPIATWQAAVEHDGPPLKCPHVTTYTALGGFLIRVVFVRDCVNIT